MPAKTPGKTQAPHFDYENARTGHLVCGIDEVGRGPWAGPVVASAVFIPDAIRTAKWVSELRDSKLLKPAKRDELYGLIMQHCAVGIGEASVEEIDTVNILEANWLAMGRAMQALPQGNALPYFALVDGNLIPKNLPCKAQAIVKGDQHSCSIAAASIIAKVTRDRIMAELCAAYPAYGFSQHVGYGTAQHQKALAEHGPCPVHRKSFKPIAALLAA
ncbi:MAG TPA: ribonuclease HII [Alphaproteobacteria bacterium]